MLFDIETVPTRKELLVDLAAFGATVVAAVVLSWSAADIVWASWITSLLLGMVFFLLLSLKKLWDFAVAVPDDGTWNEGPEEEEKQEKESGDAPKPVEGNAGCLFLAVGGLMALLAWFAGPGPVRVTLLALVGLHAIASVVGVLARRRWLGLSLGRPAVRALFFVPTSLFMFFFFLVHFGGFHLGHAFALRSFVPPQVDVTVATDSAIVTTVQAVVPEGFVGETLVGDTSTAETASKDSLAPRSDEPADLGEAWAELREAFVDVRGALFGFFALLVLTYWPYILSVAAKSYGTYRDALLARSKRGEEMLLPYKYVIRVHLLIFVLIPLAALGSGLVLTFTVLAFFFFPVESVVAWARNR